MARVSKVVACMFCNEAPCVCNAKPKKSTPRKRTSVPAVPIVSAGEKQRPEKPSSDRSSDESSAAKKAVLTAAIRSSATTAHQGAAIVLGDEPILEADLAWILDHPEMVDAIKACEPLLHPMEKTRLAKVLAAPARSPSDRAKAWKGRIVNG